MKTPDRVLEFLYDRRDGFVSRDELREALRLDERRLARALEALREAGQQIEESPAHGLRLAWPLRLSAHLIERGLGVERIGRHVIVFDEVDSTNDVAFDSARQRDSDGLTVLAESQRKGRGRLGRTWVSPPAANVLMSFLLLHGQPQPTHEAMTIAAGLATAEGIEAVCGVACRLKWPNDVILDGVKLSGILVEVRGQDMVIGIGVNCNARRRRPR